MRMFVIAAAGLLVCSPAFAQTSANSPLRQGSQAAMPQAQQNSQENSQGNTQGSSQPISPQAQNQQTTTEIADALTNKLQQAGYKNIKLIPSGFIVRADDQNNNPVVLVVNPGSITTVEGPKEAQRGNNNDHRTIGQGVDGSSNDGNSSGSTQQPNQ